MLQKDFVTFYSPGTFQAEMTTMPISSWDEEEAIEMAKSIVERHDARPYGFRFTTRGREDDELDSRELARSGMYYINGVVRTLEEVEADEKSSGIILDNMRYNKWDKIVETYSPYKWTSPFNNGDKIVRV